MKGYERDVNKSMPDEINEAIENSDDLIESVKNTIVGMINCDTEFHNEMAEFCLKALGVSEAKHKQEIIQAKTEYDVAIRIAKNYLKDNYLKALADLEARCVIETDKAHALEDLYLQSKNRNIEILEMVIDFIDGNTLKPLTAAKTKHDAFEIRLRENNNFANGLKEYINALKSVNITNR